MRRLILAAAVCLAGQLAATPLHAVAVVAGVQVRVDGQSYGPVPVWHTVDDGKLYYQIGVVAGVAQPNRVLGPDDFVEPYQFSTANGDRVTISGILNPDPFMLTSITVQDAGLPSSFWFSWSTPIDPTGPVAQVRSSISAAFTEGSSGTAFTFNPDNPDASGKVLSSSLGGATMTHTPGLDIGPAFAAGAAAAGTQYSVYSQDTGYLVAPPGVWTALGLNLGFSLGGGLDIASVNVYTSIIPTPLPGALWLLTSSLLGMGVFARRAQP